ncbi:transcription termination factor NusA [Fastidiosipila sanguinis]|uniref:Transcription termination/antitermination protein NusA n=1 Tax=Fastidiosipila sanguinis TaxID=236753 RepID=A0A2S0KLI6_9FIRM|nr:transcription termination factor NusA [Fastidiosipila sanguinis]AVM41893.1 transcription termination/antitermination protein NusA [Fastidiosipila sanguinis]
MNIELITAIRDLCKERGLDEDGIFTAIEESLVAAYKREFNARTSENVTASINRETGEMAVFLEKEIVEEVEDPNSQIPLSQAKAIDEDFEEGDVLQYQLEPQDFGRLAAQAAKSAINQSLISAERQMIHDEFRGRIGELASGTVQRADKREVIVDIGRAEATLTSFEQSSLDTYEFNERMQFLIKKVDERRGRPVIYVSRASEKLVEKLFEKEVPEIAAGVVEIVSSAREAGSRTKIAVHSHDENVDALGACVGQRGIRVQNVMDELRGEKIDIIEWDEDETVFIKNAMKPSSVLRVDLVETTDENGEAVREATVVVPDSQLSLAIGKRGQNARLAAKLTGWKIDIKNESEARELLESDFMAEFSAIADTLAEEHDAETVEELDEELLDVAEVEDETEASIDDLADQILSAGNEDDSADEDEAEAEAE